MPCGVIAPIKKLEKVLRAEAEFCVLIFEHHIPEKPGSPSIKDEPIDACYTYVVSRTIQHGAGECVDSPP